MGLDSHICTQEHQQDKPKAVCYWRKHYMLHAFMEEEWRKTTAGQNEGQAWRLKHPNRRDLVEMIDTDRLDLTLPIIRRLENRMQERDFYEDTADFELEDRKQDDARFLQLAKEALGNKTIIFYTPS